MDFVDEQAFAETHLWTFAGLNAARHLYETLGLHRIEERKGSQWGSEVLEQRFVRSLGARVAADACSGGDADAEIAALGTLSQRPDHRSRNRQCGSRRWRRFF